MTMSGDLLRKRACRKWVFTRKERAIAKAKEKKRKKNRKWDDRKARPSSPSGQRKIKS
jgi:hypothetical protein